MSKLYGYLSHYKKLFIFIFFLFIVILIWFAIRFFAPETKFVEQTASGTEQSTNQLAISTKQQQQAGINTQVLTPATKDISSSISLQGQAQWAPQSKIMVTSPISGVIQQIFVQPLADIAQSKKIVAIHSPDVVQIQNEILQLHSQKQLYSQNLARERQLFAEGIIAEKRVQEARNQLQQVNIQLEAKQRMLQFMGGSSASGLNPVVYVNSPAQGLIEALNVTAGQRVEIGSVIGQIINRKIPLILTLQTPIKNVAHIHTGDTVSVEGCQIKGRVVKIAPMLNGNTQTHEVMVQMGATDPCLNVNQYIKAQIQSSMQANQSIWSVPSSAIMLRGGTSYIFVKQGTGLGFTAVPVDVVSSTAQITYITGSTLKTGLEVAVTGVERLKAILSGFGAEQAPTNNSATTK